MKNLYESLLADIEDTLEVGDISSDIMTINAKNSDVRKMFDLIDISKEPFSIYKENGKNIFDIRIGCYTHPLLVDCNNYTLSNCLKNIVNNNINTLQSDTVLCFTGGHNNVDFSDKTVAKNIVAEIIKFQKIKYIENINIIAKKVSSDNRYLNSITFDQNIIELKNCKLDIFSNHDNNRLPLCNIPTFKNVSSDTIRYITIDYTKADKLGEKVKEWNMSLFKNLFEFGYELEYYVGKVKTSINKIQIKDMKSIRKLVTSSDFYNRVYNEWPYKLKKGAKLSDIIDISKFNKLYMVSINDNKMAVIFENINDNLSKNNEGALYYCDLLKNAYMTHQECRDKIKIMKYIPVTADGFRVYIIRY